MSRATIFTAISVVFLLVAMVFLVLGMVSAPVTTALKLASSSDYTYGIFGYCEGSTCLTAGYPVSFGNIDSKQDWLLSSDTRNTLAKTFIVAPIAAGIAFFSIIFTVISLFVASTPVKIFSLVFGVIAFIATTLVGIMVVLVFYPFVAWTGWLYIAAAGLTLLAVPCLLLSIRVIGGDDESEVESTEKQFGTYGNDTSFSTGPLLNNSLEPKFQFYGPRPNNNTTDELSSVSKDYSYRGAMTGGYTAAKNGSRSSLLDSNPHLVNDITKPDNMPAANSRNNSNSSFYEDAVNLNQGPSTPISSKQKMAPNFVPNVAIPSNNSGYKPVSSLPYPQSERGSTSYGAQGTQDGYSGTTLGVFDHHPNVEGHQPFTELGDNDLPERTSLSPGRQIDSDEDSDFTSVSQRPPNVMYQAPPPQPNFQQQQQQQRPQQQLYQQLYPNVSQYQPSYQQSQPAPQGQPFQPSQPFQQQSQPSSYYGSEGGSQYNPHYQVTGYQQPAFQGGYQQQAFAPQPRPQNRGPTVSDNVLNNNPDFSVGTGRKKNGFIPPAKRYGNPAKPPQRPRTASRDGPYGML